MADRTILSFFDPMRNAPPWILIFRYSVQVSGYLSLAFDPYKASKRLHLQPGAVE